MSKTFNVLYCLDLKIVWRCIIFLYIETYNIKKRTGLSEAVVFFDFLLFCLLLFIFIFAIIENGVGRDRQRKIFSWFSITGLFLGNLVSLLIGVSLVGKRVLGEALFRFIAVSRHLRIRVEMVSNQYQEMDFIGTYRLSPVRAVSKGTFAECCES